MRVERGRRYELRHNTNATALICAAGLLFPACCRSFPAVSRWFPFPAPSRYGLCTVAYSGVSARSIGWLSVRLSRMGATQLHYHCLRFNSSTGSRTTLCGPPRILAGSIRFIGYNVPWQGFAPCMSGLPSYAHRAFLRPEKRERLSPNRLQGYRCHSTRHHSVYLFRHTVMSKCRS